MLRAKEIKYYGFPLNVGIEIYGDALAVPADFPKLLKNAVSKLKKSEKLILAERYIKFMTYGALGEKHSYSDDTAKYRIKKILRKIKKARKTK